MGASRVGDARTASKSRLRALCLTNITSSSRRIVELTHKRYAAFWGWLRASVARFSIEIKYQDDVFETRQKRINHDEHEHEHEYCRAKVWWYQRW